MYVLICKKKIMGKYNGYADNGILFSVKKRQAIKP